MNEINFEIKDIEKIDLSMDVGIKQIYPPIDDLKVTPTKEQQVFTHESSYGYDKVTVEPIPEEYIIPEGTLPITENATYDVTNYARVSASVHPTPNLQDKEITTTENGTQTITYDEGYDGLNSVEVTTNISGNKYAPRTLKLSYYEGTELDYEVANVDISNLTTMSDMFNSCKQITSLDLSHWNTSNATYMSSTFSGCNALTSLNLSGWVTSNVKEFTNMFKQCSSLTSLDLSSFTAESLERVTYMFDGCTSLKHLDVRNFNFTKLTTATTYNYAFRGIPSDCEIIVMNNSVRNWLNSKGYGFTNIKTVAEL